MKEELTFTLNTIIKTNELMVRSDQDWHTKKKIKLKIDRESMGRKELNRGNFVMNPVKRELTEFEWSLFRFKVWDKCYFFIYIFS